MASNATEKKDTVVPRFFKAGIKNDARSAKEGRLICDDVEMVTTIIPGDRLTKPSFVVTDVHRQRWPNEYAAFKRGEEIAQSGTPLEHWPLMTTARVMELKAVGILSVDMLADVSDANLGALGPNGRDLREQAKSYIAAAKDGALVASQTATIDALNAKIARLEDIIANQAKQPADKPARGKNKEAA